MYLLQERFMFHNLGILQKCMVPNFNNWKVIGVGFGAVHCKPDGELILEIHQNWNIKWWNPVNQIKTKALKKGWLQGTKWKDPHSRRKKNHLRGRTTRGTSSTLHAWGTIILHWNSTSAIFNNVFAPPVTTEVQYVGALSSSTAD